MIEFSPRSLIVRLSPATVVLESENDITTLSVVQKVDNIPRYWRRVCSQKSEQIGVAPDHMPKKRPLASCAFASARRQLTNRDRCRLLSSGTSGTGLAVHLQVRGRIGWLRYPASLGYHLVRIGHDAR